LDFVVILHLAAVHLLCALVSSSCFTR
jgi:hypothetical protein